MLIVKFLSGVTAATLDTGKALETINPYTLQCKLQA